MFSVRFARYVVSALTMSALLGALACSRSGPDQKIHQMAKSNAELDELSQQAGNPGIEPIHNLEASGGHKDSFQAYTTWLQSGDEQ